VIEHSDLAAWRPWSREWSTAWLLQALLPAVIVLERRFSLQSAMWRRRLLLHLLISVPFSLIHMLGMFGREKSPVTWRAGTATSVGSGSRSAMGT